MKRIGLDSFYLSSSFADSLVISLNSSTLSVPFLCCLLFKGEDRREQAIVGNPAKPCCLAFATGPKGSATALNEDALG